MSVDSIIYTRLTTHAGLVAMVSTRTYPVVIPVGATFPLCVYSRVSDVPITELSGPIMLRESRYQVSCYAVTRPAALAVAEQVVLALHNYAVAGLKQSRFENMLEILEDGAGPIGQDLYHVPVDFMIIT